MLQCLMVAVRPLRVEELAELLAFEFDVAQGGIPKYRAAWRLDDQTQAVLSTCSSLVTIVKERWTSHQVVQFSHFSVKEFLTSNRLGDFSRYDVRPISAHTMLTQACLGFLLHLDDHIDKESVKSFHFAKYAARHWAYHAQFEDVAEHVKEGMEMLFDPDKPHFAAWVEIYDLDQWHPLPWLIFPISKPNRLYYSVLCGFYRLVKHLAIKHPQHIDVICGEYRFPLFVAFCKGRMEVLKHGANVEVLETTGELAGETILHKAFSQSLPNVVDIVKFLLKHGTDVNARDKTLRRALHLAEERGCFEVAQMFVEHKAEVNSQDKNGKTPLGPLHLPLEIWTCQGMYNKDAVLDHMQLLVEHGVDVNRSDKNNQTPLLLATRQGWFKLARVLLEHGADANAENNDGKTPLHFLSEWWNDYERDGLDLTWLLLEHGADVNRRDKMNQTPLLLAIRQNWLNLVRILLKHGADVNAEGSNSKTPLHVLSESWKHYESDALDLIWLLLERDADLNRRDKDNQTPLLLAMGRDWYKLARILVEHGADVNAENNNGKTPLHMLSESYMYKNDYILDHARLLLEHGAEVNMRDKDNQTPLLLAMGRDWYKLARILIGHGADANAENKDGKTPLHLLLESRGHDERDALDLTRVLFEHGAVENRRDRDNQTPLLLALGRDWFNLARVLVAQGADADAVNNNGKTSFHLLSESRIHDEGDALDLVWLLLEHGMEVNRRDKDNQTPLLLAMGRDWFKLARILLEHGATADVENNDGNTPLHLLSESQIHDEGNALDLVWLLLEHRAATVMNNRNKNNQAPLPLAMERGWFKLASILLEHGADANAESNLDNGKTPLYIASTCQIYNKINVGDVLNHKRSWLEHGAEVNRRYKDSGGSLLLGIGKGKYKFTWNLLSLLKTRCFPRGYSRQGLSAPSTLTRPIRLWGTWYRYFTTITRAWRGHPSQCARQETQLGDTTTFTGQFWPSPHCKSITRPRCKGQRKERGSVFIIPRV